MTPLGVSHSHRARAFRGEWSAPSASRLYLAGLVLAAACSGDPAPVTSAPSTATALLVTLTRDSVRAREVAQATVEGRDAGGRTVAIGSVVWTTTDPAVATVSTGGRVVAVGDGETRVVATIGAVHGEAAFRVFPVPVNAVVITPLKTLLAPGQTMQLTARAIDAAGGMLPGRPIGWLSSDTTRVVVDDQGRVTARAPGVVSIAAISEQVYSTVEVRVSGPPGPVATVSMVPAAMGLRLGDSGTLTTLLEDADGNEATDRPIVWESLNPAVATVTPTGRVSAVSRGMALVRATCEGRVGIAEVTVTDLADSITVTFAEPIKDDIVGDTLVIFADVKSRNPIVRAHARLTSTERFETDLVATPIGVFGARIAWVGAIDVTFLHYGAYQVVITSIDSQGNSSVASQPFKRGTRAGSGGTTLPPRSK